MLAIFYNKVRFASTLSFPPAPAHIAIESHIPDHLFVFIGDMGTYACRKSKKILVVTGTALLRRQIHYEGFCNQDTGILPLTQWVLRTRIYYIIENYSLFGSY